jgi:putative ABC transport system permease protein
MNIIQKCCYRSLKENRKRTVVTIVGVLLSTSLITAVACMVVSFQASMLAYEKRENGDYHYCFVNVREENLKYFQNNRNIVKIGVVEEIGYALLEESQNPDKPYLYISAVDEEGIGALSLRLLQGRMPENDSELVIGRHIRTNGLVDYRIGDVITVQTGSRISEGALLGQKKIYLYEDETLEVEGEKTYTIVGIIERPNVNVEDRIAPGYSAFTRLEDNISGKELNLYVTYTKWGVQHANQVTAGILGVPETLYHRYCDPFAILTSEEEQQLQKMAKSVNENYWIIRWELLAFPSDTMNMLYAMSAMAIMVIIVTSVFCIRNSFVISLTEKMKLYGRLACVGTTAGQQRRMVYYEAFLLGGIGIPLGVICGVVATAILVKAVGGLVEDAIEIFLVFDVSWAAILFGVVLSGVTVFLSAYKPARQAAKLSPVSAVRGNDFVKTGKRKLRCPAMLHRLFGIGGKVAYKNLKRAKVKYRTTVISIVVSVAAFIGLTTFTSLMSFASTFHYEERQYQLMVSLWDVNFKKCYEKAQQIAALDGVQAADISAWIKINVDGSQIPYTQAYLDTFENDDQIDQIVVIRTLGEQGFERYCEGLGISPQQVGEKAILIAPFETKIRENGKLYSNSGRIAQYQPGDVIDGSIVGSAELLDTKNECALEVYLQTDEIPMSGIVENSINLIVNDQWLDKCIFPDDGNMIHIYILCEDSGSLEKMIRTEMPLINYSITNYEEQYRSSRSLSLLVSIFLYGFITVVALIGITNIFNTITTNMELRAPEFAMLKSVGMTNREFRRMIWLEGLFYGGKALLIGIPLGLLISLGFHRALGEGIVTEFRFPWMGVTASCAAVAVLLYLIMHYSMAKINRKNIMDTIRNENI